MKDYLDNVNNMLGLKNSGNAPPTASKSKIPAYMGAGGTLRNLKDAVEFRVWAHPNNGGDDRFLRYDSLPYAMAGYRYFRRNDKNNTYEEPMAVIKDPKATNGYREVIIPKSMLKKY